jgi:F420-non-reducing hydrogenase large subunit
MTTLTISPVTRIEGHAQVRITLDEKGQVSGAHFNVVELRGFEKFLIGAAVEEAPRITPRICGICPASHHLASAKATDQIFGATLPPTATLLRELLLCGQYMHSHSLHFFMLAAPDFLIGHDAPAAERNVLGLARKSPDLAKKAIEVRTTGQRITEAVGGKAIHPTNAVPGGMSRALDTATVASLREMAKGAMGIATEGWGIARSIMENADPAFGAVESGFAGITRNGLFSPYEGTVAMIAKDGARLGTFSGVDYLQYLEEYSEKWSYLKFCRLKGGQNYRVGPLARLNLVEGMGSPAADAALKEYRQKFGSRVQSSLAYNLARYVEFLAVCERTQAILADPAVQGAEVRVPVAEVKNARGVGIVEAPRGTLIHDYSVNKDGFIEKCNLIVATCQNNYAIDRAVEDVARKVVQGGKLTEGAANRIEMVIRAYDPCISCATHAVGAMPLAIELVRDCGTGAAAHISRSGDESTC